MRTLRARVLAGMGVLAVLVALPFVLLVEAIGAVDEAAALSSQGRAATAAVRELERLLLDLETGQRGYVISGDEQFLEPWRRARARLPVSIATAQGLIRETEQVRRLSEIEAAIGSYVEDYAEPIVEQASRDRAAAARTITRGEGMRRVEALRAQFGAFEAAEARNIAERDARVDRQVRRATYLSFGGLAGSALLVLLFASSIVRSVIGPIGRTGSAAERLAAGDLSARTPRGGPHEVDELAAAFNAMADSLEQNRAELESQNVELEAQAAELEAQQAQLHQVNDELVAQHDELERALVALATAKTRVDALYGFAADVAAEAEVGALAALALERIAEHTGAEVGVAHVVDAEGAFPAVTVRGVDAESISPVVHGRGLAGRALAERRSVSGDHGESGFAIRTFGGESNIRRELHVPLVYAERALGVLSIARLADRDFSADERATGEHLAGHAAVALASAMALRDVQRLADVNRAVLDATTDAILMVDLDGRTVVANRAMEQMASLVLDLPKTESIWEASTELGLRTTDPEAYGEALERLRSDPEREALDVYQVAGTGTWIQRYSAPVKDAHGGLLGRIFVLRNVTAERQAEQLKLDLMATVSHELRTPLASIVGFSELLVQRELDVATGRRYLQTIHSEAQRLTNLINDFLDLQRIEAGALRVELESLDLRPLLRQAVELYAGQSPKHTIVLEGPEEPLVVLAERERMAQVAGNLLSNAIKYSPDGGTVSVRAALGGDAVRVSVADEGLGIPAGQRGQIFEKFFRVDSSDTRRIGGTGLGLALSREIVEAHGGRIGFDSVEGEGSTFWFELPAGGVRRVAGDVLLVFDDPEAASTLAAWLAEDGHAVQVARSGAEALAVAEREVPALICLDACLGGDPDGWELLETLKARPATSAIPVVVCTGGNGHSRPSALGAADVLAKPFAADELYETLSRILPVRGSSVLVVDDDAAVRRLVVETLRREGVRLREASNGREALAAVAREKPDVVVLDLVMPEQDGFEVLAELNRDPATRDIPVVVLSGKRLSADERAQLRQRAVSLMEKTAYSSLELRGLVQAALGRPH